MLIYQKLSRNINLVEFRCGALCSRGLIWMDARFSGNFKHSIRSTFGFVSNSSSEKCQQWIRKKHVTHVHRARKVSGLKSTIDCLYK